MMAKHDGFTPAGPRSNPAKLPGIGKTTKVRGGRRVPCTTPTAKVKPEDPRSSALDRRAREAGLEEPAKGDAAAISRQRAQMRAPYLGDPLGRLVARFHSKHDEALALWGTWQGYCQAMQTYRLRVLDQGNPFRGGLGGWTATEIISSEEDLRDLPPPDARSLEEKAAAAKAGYRFWEGIIGRGMDPALRAALIGAERGDGPPLWRETAAGPYPTSRGLEALRALEQLHRLMMRFG